MGENLRCRRRGVDIEEVRCYPSLDLGMHRQCVTYMLRQCAKHYYSKTFNGYTDQDGMPSTLEIVEPSTRSFALASLLPLSGHRAHFCS